MTDKEKIREAVVRMHNQLPIMDGDNISVNYADRICTTLEMYIDSLQEETVSKDLEEAAKEYAHHQGLNGAQWQKEQMEKVSDNIEKELDIYLTSNGIVAADIQFEPFTQLEKCARYFFNLGKNQRKIKI